MFVAGAAPATARSYALDPARVVSPRGHGDRARDEQIRILTARASPSRRARRVSLWRCRPGGRTCRARPTLVEIARRPLTKLEGRPLTRPAGVAKPVLTPMQRREGQARRRIAAQGFNRMRELQLHRRDGRPAVRRRGEAVRLENPISLGDEPSAA